MTSRPDLFDFFPPLIALKDSLCLEVTVHIVIIVQVGHPQEHPLADAKYDAQPVFTTKR